MITVSLLLGWFRFAGTLMLGFRGIARIGEVLHGERKRLLLPRDELLNDQTTIYVRIPEPKGKRTGARVQHASVPLCPESPAITAIFESLLDDEPLFPGSPQMFRRRWDFILKLLHIPASAGITPACVRGGGCCYAFSSGASISDLLWRMRIRQQDTLGHYLQETMPMQVLSSMSAEARLRTALFSKFTDLILHWTTIRASTLNFAPLIRSLPDLFEALNDDNVERDSLHSDD
jgi:hypothetical protein